MWHIGVDLKEVLLVPSTNTNMGEVAGLHRRFSLLGRDTDSLADPQGLAAHQSERISDHGIALHRFPDVGSLEEAFCGRRIRDDLG